MTTETLQRWANPRIILVATNLADEQVLTFHAAAQARDSGAGILLVHVLPPLLPPSDLEPAPDPLVAAARESAAREVLERMATMIDWEGAPCEPILLHGQPVDRIAELVNERGVDRVMVATRSARGLDRLLSGSVAEGLMAALDIPVCVIGPHVVAGALSGMAVGNILLALSLHHERPDCVRFAGLLARRRHTALTLMHAVDVTGMEAIEKEEALRSAHHAIAALMASSPGLPRGTAIAIREGSPAKAILSGDVCPEWEMIVMGASSGGVLTQLLGSSAVYRVIADAHCPVMTLRPSAASRKKISVTQAGALASNRPDSTRHSTPG
jgi:nucleotide-binding universal stress UspA family protein